MNDIDQEWINALAQGLTWHQAKELAEKRQKRVAAVAKRLLGDTDGRQD